MAKVTKSTTSAPSATKPTKPTQATKVTKPTKVTTPTKPRRHASTAPTTPTQPQTPSAAVEPGSTLRGVGNPRIVAVVGAFGALGRRLLPLLEEDPAIDTVVAIDVRSGAELVDDDDVDHAAFLMRHPKLTAHVLDLTTPGADAELAALLRAQDVGALFHLAMLSTPTHHKEMAHELETVGTHYVLNAVAASRVERLIAVSSAMVYGARPDNPAFLTEEAPLRPPPSRSLKDKADADAEVRRFAAAHPGVAVCVARLGAMVPVSPDHFWTRTLSRRVVPAVLGYDPLVQLLHPDDAVGALVALWRARAHGPVNVVGRGFLPLSHILTRLGAVPVYLPAGLGQSVIGALWQAQLIEMPAHFLGYLRWSWLCDDRRLRQLTGFVPRHDLLTVLQILATHTRAAGEKGAAP